MTIDSGAIYHALPTGCFRILKLLPAVFGNDIQCKLEVHRLGIVEDPGQHGCPPYTAISYVWGDPKERLDILVDGQRVSITRSLFDVLNTFRRKIRSRLLWADALCINQADLSERAAQVNLMGQIYSNCEACNIWLGKVDEPNLRLTVPPADNSGLDPRQMHNAMSESCIQTEPDVKSAVALLYILNTVPYYDLEGMKKAVRRCIEPMCTLERAVGSLIHIMSRPWWYRIWTVQEIILPCRYGRNVQLFVGPQSIDFRFIQGITHRGVYRYVGAFQNAGQKPVNDLLFSVLRASFLLAYRLLDMLQPNPEPHYGIARHLDALKGRACTDPRDAIYGLAGVFEYPLTSAPTSYVQTVGQCFSHATKTYAAYRRSLEHLRSIDPLQQDKGLPSWAIDYSQELPEPPLILPERDSRRMYISDGVETFYDVLQVEASILTHVKGILPASAWDSSTTTLIPMLTSWFRAVAKVGTTYGTYLDVVRSRMDIRASWSILEREAAYIDSCDPD